MKTRKTHAPTLARKKGWRKTTAGWTHPTFLTIYATARDALAAQKRSNAATY